MYNELYMLKFYRATETESCLPEEINFTVDTSSAFDLSTHQNIGIYGGIVAFTVFIVTMRAVLCYLVILAASRSIHNKMLMAVLRTPVLFFDTNPVGEYFTAIYNSVFMTSCIENHVKSRKFHKTYVVSCTYD